MMEPYPKINTLYKRDEKGKILVGEYARPEFELLADVDWIWTEKVDGTNIRLHWSPEGYNVPTDWIAGRTNKAQIPPFLEDRLVEIIQTRPFSDHFDSPITLYGEGYGARIQKGGGSYIPDGVDFIVFDVKINDTWLDYDDVVDVASKLDLDVVNKVHVGTIAEAENLVLRGFDSAWVTVLPEGLVGRPAQTLFNKNGTRILCKLKHVDYDRIAPFREDVWIQENIPGVDGPTRILAAPYQKWTDG